MNISHLAKNQVIIAVVFTLLLSACGGSGSSSEGPERPPVNPIPQQPVTGTLTPLLETSDVQIFGDGQLNASSTAGFAIVPAGNRIIEQVQWSQTSGPSVQILASNSQTVGFDVPDSGNYSFNVDVKFIDAPAQESYSFSVAASSADPSVGSVRLDHTVAELDKVSLHAGEPNNKRISTVEWTQISGPSAQNVVPNEEFLFFDAPSVSRDEVIAYRANINYTDGTNATDDIYVTVKNINFDTNGLFYRSDFFVSPDMHAFNPASPFAQAIERCVYNNSIPATPDCNFNELPLIGTSHPNPSVQNILDRTLVSHKWMGERFEEYLRNSAAGPDMLNLLRGVTAIVISYEVRPSFYWAATGAIYLDANSFWRTPNERDTLNDQPDFRSDFGSDLQFQFFWRYVKDNQYFPAGRYSKQDRQQRTFSDQEASLSWLLYHELAHANDFFPPTVWSNINSNTTPLAYFNANGTNSDVLDTRYPLRSDELHALAEVRFRNETPSDAQKALVGADVVPFFEPDISPSFYSYLTIREDFATLVERFMMLYRLGADSDVAIIEGETSNDFDIAWGQRNRIAADSLQDRTAFAVGRVYPELGDVSALISALPEPLPMDASEGWFGNLDLSANGDQSATVNASQAFINSLSKQEKLQFQQQDSRIIHTGKPVVPNLAFPESP
jgi:hypothetical protein